MFFYAQSTSNVISERGRGRQTETLRENDDRDVTVIMCVCVGRVIHTYGDTYTDRRRVARTVRKSLPVPCTEHT